MTIEEIEKLIDAAIKEGASYQSICKLAEQEIIAAKKFMGMDGMIKLVFEKDEKVMVQKKIFDNAKNELIDAINEYASNHFDDGQNAVLDKIWRDGYR